MLTERMKKVELLVLKKDIDAVLAYLGRKGCLQPEESSAKPGQPQISRESPWRALKDRLRLLEDFLGQPAVPVDDAEAGLLTEEAAAAIERLIESTQDLSERERRLLERKLQIEGSIDELKAFNQFKLPLSELEIATFLSLRYGAIETGRLEEARLALAKRAVILELAEPGRVIAVASKKGRFALNSELNRFGFRELELPKDVSDLPGLVLEKLRGLRESLGADFAGLDKEKAAARASLGPRLREWRASCEIMATIEELKSRLEATDTVFKLRGWVRRSSYRGMARELEVLTANRIALRVYDPDELSEVAAGRESVPVSIRHGRLVRAFEGIVFSYGVPLYGTIDPTPFTAFFFVFLFAVMFGDVGQGLVGVAIGWLLGSGKLAALRKYGKFGPIFMIVGAASTFTGFLYGSFFANEELLAPVTRLLFGVDRLVSVMPTAGVDKLLLFFAFTVGVGVVINSVGLIINIYNNVKLKHYGKAFFSKTGLAGAVFFWSVLAGGILLFARSGLAGLFAAPAAAALAVLFFSEPLHRWLRSERSLFPEGLGIFIIEGLVEILESVSYYFSNTLSFLRVGAFAMSHAVLSYIIFILAELVGRAPGGPIYQVLVAVIGNVLIMGLEGLIVAIQVIRLQYYEFFSKFFTETGRRFDPFRFA